MVTASAATRAITRDELRRLIWTIETRPRRQPGATQRVTREPLEVALRRDWTRAAGGVLTREEVLPPDYVHGTQPLTPLQDATGDVLALLAGDAELTRRSAADLLFLDIETTGLGGSGAMVFLVTTGRPLADGFLLRQYLAPSPAEEGALLALLGADGAIATGHPVLATYNGRVFDAPILDQRSTMHRMRGGYEALTQLDVLSPMRRGFRGTLESCRLGAVEWSLLGVTRPADEVAGVEVPGWYFRYLSSGDHRYLAPLIAHNAVDVLSLAALTARLVSLLRGDTSASGVEHLAAGRLHLRARAMRAAEHHLTAAAELLPAGWAQDAALLALAMLHKRGGNDHRAVPLWTLVAERPGGAGLVPLIELAKYHEHVTRDYTAALAATERAVVLAGERPALEHRRARLLRRLDRQEPPHASR